MPLGGDLGDLHGEKLERALAYSAGGSFVWFDDEVSRRERAALATWPGVGPSLLRHVSPGRGLAAADFDAAGEFHRSLRR